MDFEDLMCMTADEIEYGIYCIAKRFGKDLRLRDAVKHEAEIREDLTIEFHGCYPYHYGDEELPCYFDSCDYGCKHCPMWDANAIGEYAPKLDEISDMVIALIRAIKMDVNYEPTEDEVKTAIEIIRGARE